MRSGHHHHRRSRFLRKAGRFWPLILGLAFLVAFLIVVKVNVDRQAAAERHNKADRFGITIVNASGEIIKSIDVHLWWPDDTVETTYQVTNLGPDALDAHKIFAPPGFRLRMVVTMPNGQVTRSDMSVPAGTEGMLRVNIHEDGKMYLE